MDKKVVNEQDNRSMCIVPVIHASGWNALRQVGKEVQLTKGRVNVNGKMPRPSEPRTLPTASALESFGLSPSTNRPARPTLAGRRRAKRRLLRYRIWQHRLATTTQRIHERR